MAIAGLVSWPSLQQQYEVHRLPRSCQYPKLASAVMLGGNALLSTSSVLRRCDGLSLLIVHRYGPLSSYTTASLRWSLPSNRDAENFSLNRKSWNLSRKPLSRTLETPEDYSKDCGRYRCRAPAMANAQAIAVAEDKEIEKVKYELLNAVLETGRGLKATGEQRAIVEEAMVGVEKFDAGMPLELDRLDGTWLLQYTTAPDVVQILQASETPLFQVGQIFQKFECIGQSDGGVVRNVVRWSIPQILQEDGATLVVTAKFSVVSPRSIALKFEEAQLGNIVISEGLQGLLAPAVLPRTFLNLEVLQFFRAFNVRVPLLRPTSIADNNARVPVGLWYYLTYLDRDMLLGRALGNGGVFIFSRTQQLELF